MSNRRSWAFWRRVQYATGSVMTIMLIFLTVYAIYFVQPASCFDNELNGRETGVDCGGDCVRICAADVIPPIDQWARSFQVLPGQYNAVAYVENKNQTAATPEMNYTFSLYDNDGLITERSGKTILPPNSVYPIFEQRIDTGSRIPNKTFITLEPAPLWIPATSGREQFRVVRRELFNSDSDPRLEATIENTALTEANDVEVVATIFDTAGTALTSSRTIIPRIPPRSEYEVTFTWPEPIAKTVRSCEVPSDVMMILDRSGSMAADGGDPPEPLESAKKSAQSFVQQLGENDQVGFVSYATMPSNPIEQVLTRDKRVAINAIDGTRMGEDGTQYTNMGEAFRVALEEITSVRHDDNSRKVMVFLTDGDVTRPLNPEGERDVEYAAQFAKEEAQKAKDDGVLIYTIGFGDFFLEIEGELSRDVELIKDLASEPDMYYEAPTLRELNEVYRQIASDICEEGIAVIDIVPKTRTSFQELR